MQLPTGTWFAPPDGNRSRLFLSNEILGISLRGAGQHQFLWRGVERKGLFATVTFWFEDNIKQMRRWHLYVAAALIAVLLLGFGVRHSFEERAKRKRDIEYQKALRSYSAAIKTGMTRKQVEDYFAARGISFRQMCCVSVKEFSRGVYDNSYEDLVKIAQEDVPFVCSENNVSIAFQFLGSGKDSPPRAEASDKLKDLTIYHWLEGCP